MRLGLDGERRAFGERHDAGVADEGTAQERCVDRDRRVAQLVHQWRDGIAVSVGDASSEGLVRAVLAPRLGQRLQLDVGGRTAGGTEVIDDRVQLGEVKRQSTFAIERQQRLVVEPVYLDHLDAGVCGGIGIDEGRLDRADRPSFDHLVGQQPSRQDRHGVVVDIAADLVASSGGDCRDRCSDRFGSQGNCLGSGIGHTRQQCGLDGGGFRDRPVAGLQQRVDEQSLELVTTAAAVDKHQVSDVDRGDVGQSECVSIRQQRGGAGIRAG